MLKLSIIIPTYNRAKYIKEAIESVFAQTVSTYEIIVIDDGSSDNTLEVLEPYLSKIKYIKQSNKGVSAARNRGIYEAENDWIAFLDSDDLWLPQKLEMQLKYVADINLIYSHRAEWFIDDVDNSKLLDKCKNVSWPKTDRNGIVVNPVLSVAQADPYMTPSIICNRKCFDKIGLFDENFVAGEDEDWLSRASLVFKFHFLNTTLAKIRYHKYQTGLGSEKSVRSLVAVMNKMVQRTRHIDAVAFRVAKSRYANKLSHLANILSQQNRKRDSLECATRAYCANPKKISRLFKIGLILIGLNGCR